MDIYIDTASLEEIRRAASLGILDGVTTDPSLVAKEGVEFRPHLQEICRMVEGPVSAEVVATDHQDMIAEGEDLARIAGNIVVRLPSTVEGLRACTTLASRGIRVNMTLCFQPLQALMAAKAGAFLVSPLVGRVDDVAGDGMEIIRLIRQIYDNYGYETRILAASIRHPQHLVQAALLGSDAATCPFKVIQQVMQHPLTDVELERFLADWRTLQASRGPAREPTTAVA
jgi:transaldolase